MTTQVIPVDQLDTVGVVRDTPGISLPTNAFSNARNVRFDDGAIKKMQGHVPIFENLVDTDGNEIILDDLQFVAYWPNPNLHIYIVVNRDGSTDHIYGISIVGSDYQAVLLSKDSNGYSTSGQWQSTIFNGGYSFVMNNGVDTPQISSDTQRDTADIPLFKDFPGWASYTVDSEDSNLDDDTVVSTVSAGIVIAAGNVLLAGDLEERDADDDVIRDLRGVVRSSDVAVPGQDPQNWNPFASGAGTADELIIADTGQIRAMATLQGDVYVYTSDSIHRVNVSNSGLSTVPVTTQYGALSQNAVFEFDGKHVVVGSNDIYIFGGHPGNIQSIADGRVRRYFYERFNPIHRENISIHRNLAFDEIWITYATTASLIGESDEALIWNYRDNTWTLRDMPGIWSGTVAPIPGGGAPNRVFVFNEETPSGNTAQMNDGRQEVQTMTIDGDIRAKHTGIAQEQTFSVPVQASYEAAGNEVIHLSITGDPGPNTVAAVYTIAMPTFSFDFDADVLNGGALLTLTLDEPNETFSIPANSLSGLSGSVDQNEFATAVNDYINGDNLSNFQWGSTVSDATLTLTSDVVGARQFTAATLTTYEGETVTISGSQSSANDSNNMRLVRTALANVTDSDTGDLANATQIGVDVQDSSTTSDETISIGWGSAGTNFTIDTGDAGPNTVTVTVTIAGDGQQTITRNDNDSEAFSGTSGTFTGVDGVSYTVSTSGDFSNGNASYTRTTNVFQRTFVFTNNTDHNLSVTTTVQGANSNTSTINSGASLTRGPFSGTNEAWSYSYAQGRWTATNNRTETTNQFQSGVFSYMLTVDGQTFDLGDISADGGTATQTVPGTVATATYSAQVNQTTSQTFNQSTANNSNVNTVSSSNIEYQRKTGDNIAAIDSGNQNSAFSSGGLAATYSSAFNGSLVIDNDFSTYGGIFGAFTIQADTSVILIGAQHEDKGGGSSTIGYTINVGGTTQSISSHDNTGNGAFIVDRYIRGPAYQNGDQNQIPGGNVPLLATLSAGQTFNIVTPNNPGNTFRYREATRAETFSSTLTNTSGHTKILNSNTTGVSGTASLANGASRTLLSNSSSSTYRFAANSVARYDYDFRKTDAGLATITHADGDITDVALTTSFQELVTNTFNSTINIQGSFTRIDGAATVETAPTRTQTTAGVGVFGISAADSPSIFLSAVHGSSGDSDFFDIDFEPFTSSADTKAELRDELFARMQTHPEFLGVDPSDANANQPDNAVYYITEENDTEIRLERITAGNQDNNIFTFTFATEFQDTEYAETAFGGDLTANVSVNVEGQDGSTPATVRMSHTNAGNIDLILGGSHTRTSIADAIAQALNRNAFFTATNSAEVITAVQANPDEDDTEIITASVLNDPDDLLASDWGGTFVQTIAPQDPEESDPIIRIELPGNSNGSDAANDRDPVMKDVSIVGDTDTTIDDTEVAAQIATAINDDANIRWSVTRSNAVLTFTSDTEYSYNRVENGLGTGTVNNILWNWEVLDSESYEAETNPISGTGDAVETTAGIQIRYGSPTEYDVVYSDGTVDRYVFGGDFDGQTSDFTNDIYVSQGGASLTRVDLDDMATTMEEDIDAFGEGRIDVSYINATNTLTVAPTQFADDALTVTDINLIAQGAVAPATRTAAIPSDADTGLMTPSSSGESEFDDERPWATTTINEARNYLVFNTDSDIYAMDIGYSFDDSDINAFVERTNLHVAPTRDVEMIVGMFLGTEGDTDQLDIRIAPSNIPSKTFDLSTDGRSYNFNVAGDDGDYKVDVRETGRLLNVRIGSDSQLRWQINALSLEIGSGGTR